VSASEPKRSGKLWLVFGIHVTGRRGPWCCSGARPVGCAAARWPFRRVGQDCARVEHDGLCRSKPSGGRIPASCAKGSLQRRRRTDVRRILSPWGLSFRT